MKDSLIKDQKFHLIHVYRKDEKSGKLTHLKSFDYLLSYKENKVHLYLPLDGSFQLIYDFGLNAGDTYEAYCNFSNDLFTVKIDSTSTITSDGINRKVQYVTSKDFKGCNLHGMVIEGIGSTENIMPRYTTVDPPAGGYIICFSNGSFSYPSGANCDKLVSVNEQPEEHINIFPNPTTGDMVINGIEAMEYEIWNAQGKFITKNKVEQNTIKTESLQEGLYILVLISKVRRHAIKVIKQ